MAYNKAKVSITMMQAKQKRWVFVAAAVGVLCALPILALPPGDMKGMKMPAMPVTVADVSESQMQGRVWYSGSLLSRDEATLASESDGVVLSVAEVGDYFNGGEVIMQLDDTLMKHTLNENQSDIKSQQARLQFLNGEVKRLSVLVKQNNVALSEFEQVKSDRDSEKAKLAAAQARTALIEERIRRMQVKAPFEGVISVRHVTKGEWLKAGDPAIDIVNLQQLEVVVRISADELPFVSRGDSLNVAINNVQNPMSEMAQAIIRTIVPVGDTQSRLFEMRLDTPAGFGLPGQAVRVEVPISEPRTKITVPEDALVIRGSGISVFRIDDAMTARRVPVSAGSSYQGRVEVNGTLQPGDKVVIRGGERLRDGVTVRFTQPSKAQ